MIAYFDTSALVPLIISEPGSERCIRLWQSATEIVLARLTYVEAAAVCRRHTGSVDYHESS